MRVTETLNRIFIVPAAMAMIPSFSAGAVVYKELFSTTVYGRSLELISYPPDWQCKLAGTLVALLSFLIIFSGLRALTRLTTRMMRRLRH
ncbi:MAG: hypothetical protein KJP05_07225 [Deltaproteobacteria bacterium]|nr:hypothetical protein [Deltaproteobacteria bacterium]